jgi:hypothetical protein
LGDNGQTGYLSVPGDTGDVFPLTSVSNGRRSVGTISTGSTHTLVLTFGASTYSAYLDGTKVIDAAPWDGSMDLLGGDFILGARYGYYGNLRNATVPVAFRGFGNTNSTFESIRTFNKVLTTDEITYWSSK